MAGAISLSFRPCVTAARAFMAKPVPLLQPDLTEVRARCYRGAVGALNNTDR